MLRLQSSAIRLGRDATIKPWIRISQPFSSDVSRYAYAEDRILRKVRMPRLLPLAPIALAWFFPTAALAYYPCNGPGPGEVLIGVDPGGNGVAPTPLCEYVGEDGGGDYSDGGSDPGGYWVDQFATLAWGTDQNGGPTYSWYVNASSQAEADNGALTQCQTSGFRDCRIAMGVTNGAIAIAIDASGTMHADWGEDARKAKKKALRFCKDQGGKGCQIDRVLESPAAWVSN
jgi:hypothetical protein